MKKYVYILILIPFLSAQCSDKGVDIDCGCESEGVVASLNEAPAILSKVNPNSTDRLFYIELDEVEPNSKYFSTLTSCDSFSFNDVIFQNETKVLISGEVKPICTQDLVRIGSSPIVISKIEVINDDKDNLYLIKTRVQ
jgi:hypothetical protein